MHDIEDLGIEQGSTRGDKTASFPDMGWIHGI